MSLTLPVTSSCSQSCQSGDLLHSSQSVLSCCFHHNHPTKRRGIRQPCCNSYCQSPSTTATDLHSSRSSLRRSKPLHKIGSLSSSGTGMPRHGYVQGNPANTARVYHYTFPNCPGHSYTAVKNPSTYAINNWTCQKCTVQVVSVYQCSNCGHNLCTQCALYGSAVKGTVSLADGRTMNRG